MKKVRVFELAKEFGMRGPDLAKLLREIGFENVKSHMTVLDDADLMMVEARLSAQGHKRKPAEDESADAAATPKKKLLTAADDDDDASLPKKLVRKELPKKSLPKAPGKRPAKKDLEAVAADPGPAPVAEAEPEAASAGDGAPRPADDPQSATEPN